MSIRHKSRLVTYVLHRQRDRLIRIASDQGSTVSEVVRRLLDSALGEAQS
jgi:hypothetical protein